MTATIDLQKYYMYKVMQAIKVRKNIHIFSVFSLLFSQKCRELEAVQTQLRYELSQARKERDELRQAYNHHIAVCPLHMQFPVQVTIASSTDQITWQQPRSGFKDIKNHNSTWKSKKKIKSCHLFGRYWTYIGGD